MFETGIAGWEAHPEVWVLVASLAAFGIYAVRVIGPKVVPAGEEIVSRKQVWFFCAGLILLWIAADYPVHEVGEQQLYSVHMLQHLTFSFFVPPLLLMATPLWLVDLILTDGSFVDRSFRRLATPLVAAVLFNFVQAISHWEQVVELSVTNGLFHYIMHILVFSTALLMWVPVVGPIPELRISPFAKCVYLFLMSVIPTIPAAWLTFAENPVYDVYDRPGRLWGVSVVDDQQAAGLIMKIGAGFFLWSVIGTIFFRWSAEQRRQDVEDRRRHQASLTYEDVTAEFERAPAPSEH
ncbi:MAG: cytochrome c oxidase assembly protein [Acidobacteria bacterium]|nr:cytochrome c oxidase assembly protein [Acidobacteriota bacterium]